MYTHISIQQDCFSFFFLLLVYILYYSLVGVYYRMRKYAHFRVIPHAVIHFKLRISVSLCGNSHVLLYPRMRKFTGSSVLPPVEIHIFLCNSACGYTH